MKQFKFTFLVVILMMVLSNVGWGQFSILSTSTNYTQDFFALGTSAGTWTNNTTLTGWYAKTDATASISAIGVNTGTTTTAGLYSFGIAGTNALTDRALGYAPSNAYFGASGIGKGYIGWRLKNNTGNTITTLTVTWTGEEWRKENNASSQTLKLFYQTGTTVTDLTAGSWTDASSLFTSPIIGATTATALDGNASANRVSNITVILTINLSAGNEIMLRWEDLNDSGNDHLLAIDDVTINAAGGAALITPALNPDLTLNNVDNNIDITFTDDATWRGAITAVKIGGTALTVTTDYLITAGNLQLKPSGLNALLTTSGSKSVTVEATGYTTASVTQVINPGAPTANSTSSIDIALGTGTTNTVTCTAKDQYNNLVSGYTFKYDATITNSNATTGESYTIDGTDQTSTVTDVDLTSTTNASGIATFTIVMPSVIDADDGISVQVQLSDGTTNVGSAYEFIKAPPGVSLTGIDPGTGDLQQGITNNILYRIKVDLINDVTDLSAVQITNNGDYVSSDIQTSGIKLWYSSDNVFDAGDATLASISSSSTGTGEVLTFNGFTKTLNIGTAYLFITADISPSATVGHTMSSKTTANTNFTFSNSVKFSGSTFASPNLHNIIAGATTLSVGDIAIISYASDDPDRFAFVTFVNINANTQINFTDNGWKADNTWRTGENIGTWTAPVGGITAGSIIQIEGTTVIGGGSMSSGLTGLSTSGDQLIAYQNASDFITGLNIDWSDWQADATNSNTSAIPTGLTNLINANAMSGENGYYNGPTSGPINFLRAAINNPANWVTTNTGPQSWPSWTFTFQNTSTLSNNVTVLNLILADNEIIYTGANTLTVDGSITLSNPGTTNMIVLDDGTNLGTLKRKITGTGSYNFPVGDTRGTTEYSPASINFTNGTFTNAYLSIVMKNDKFASNQSTTYINRYWDFTPSGMTTPVYDITLTFVNADLVGSIGELILGKYDGVNWIELSAPTGNTFSETGLNGFSTFTGGKVGLFPVTLASLNSSVSGRNIKLNWTTASEINNTGFDIERKEVRNQNSEFSKVGFIQGHGTVNTPSNYTFEDRNLQTGKYKYRLKQIDVNGNYEYFNLNGEVEIGVPKKYDLSQNYPNPFNPVTKINFDLPVDSKVTMLIYDITGREVAKLLNGEFKKAGYYTTNFNASSLSSGVYFYSLSTDAFRMTKKMVVIK